MTSLPRSWPSWLTILVIVPVAYASLLVVLRVAGKRTLSKLTAYGLAVTVAFGSLLSTVIVSRSVTLGDGVLAFVALAALQWAVAWGATRSRSLAHFVTARPTLVVCRGRVDEQQLRRQRLRIDDVRAAVRAAGYASVMQVFAVVLETDGSLSVVGGERVGRGTDAMENVEGWTEAERA